MDENNNKRSYTFKTFRVVVYDAEGYELITLFRQANSETDLKEGCYALLAQFAEQGGTQLVAYHKPKNSKPLFTIVLQDGEYVLQDKAATKAGYVRKGGWGGKRTGAGRKTVDLMQKKRGVGISLSTELIEILSTLKNKNEYVEEAIREKLIRDGYYTSTGTGSSSDINDIIKAHPNILLHSIVGADYGVYTIRDAAMQKQFANDLGDSRLVRVDSEDERAQAYAAMGIDDPTSYNRLYKTATEPAILYIALKS